MRTVELTSGIHSSALGFGCAPVLGAVDRKRSEWAIQRAIEYGITHFDLARSYGYGEAEQFVGKVIKGQRDRVVLASKFGIQANWKAELLRPVKPLVRFVRNEWKKGGAKTNLSGPPSNPVAERFLNRIPLRRAQMRHSLERSLRALNTDYLDYFFVHEPWESLLYVDELALTAEQLKAEGKIRAWGLAHMRSQTYLHSTYINRFDVLQFDNSPGALGYDWVVAERGLQANVIFSPLRGGSQKLSPVEKLQKLFADFPHSVVLCSMFDERHLKENISLVTNEYALNQRFPS